MAKTDKASANQPAKRGFFRTLSSTFFDVPRWVGARQYAEVNKTLYAKVKDSFRIAQAERAETFEAAMSRLRLTEKDLKERMVATQRSLAIMLVFIGLLFLYGFYLLYVGSVSGVLILLAVIALSAIRAFQYSFWSFQMKNRVLGCSFLDWWRGKTAV